MRLKELRDSRSHKSLKKERGNHEVLRDYRVGVLTHKAIRGSRYDGFESFE